MHLTYHTDQEALEWICQKVAKRSVNSSDVAGNGWQNEISLPMTAMFSNNISSVLVANSPLAYMALVHITDRRICFAGDSSKLMLRWKF